MSIRSSLVATTLIALLTPGLAGAADPAPQVPAKSAALSPNLTLGLPAEQVRRVLGQPLEVKPMKAPNGKAEIWVYVKEIGSRVDRVGIPTADIVTYSQGADSGMRQTITPGVVQFHDVRYVTEEITEVLLFNDHYVTQKVSRRERQDHQ